MKNEKVHKRYRIAERERGVKYGVEVVWQEEYKKMERPCEENVVGHNGIESKSQLRNGFLGKDIDLSYHGRERQSSI